MKTHKEYHRINTTEIQEDLNETLTREINRLFAQGAINFDDEPTDSAALAKCILTVALENVSKMYAPMDWDVKRQTIVKNLRNF